MSTIKKPDLRLATAAAQGDPVLSIVPTKVVASPVLQWVEDVPAQEGPRCENGVCVLNWKPRKPPEAA